jgi:D-arginine dehydrogenase
MTDIIVIGGGIAGISAAARLSEHAQVTVLEAESALGHHASGRSAALFEENYGCPSVKALNRASSDYHHNANGGYLSPRGLLILGRNGEDSAFEKDLSDLGTKELSVDEARGHVPIINDKITRAGYHKSAFDLDTDRMIQDFAKVVRANGGQIITKAKADKISYANKRWSVEFNGEILTSEILVNAAGAWADQIATLSNITTIGLTPLRRSIAQTPAPSGHDISTWPIFFGVGEAWYAKPEAGKLLISPADETLVETTWAGLRSFAPDRTLVIGRDPSNPSFVWCAAQGGYGFQTAPAASQLVADTVFGHPSELTEEIIAELSPSRFLK